MIVWEARMAGYDPTEAEITGIPYDEDWLEIRADLDEDGVTDSENETIVYEHDAVLMQLTRDTGGGPELFLDSVEQFTFDYLDENGDPTTIDDDIRQIEISITTRASKSDRNFAENDGFRTYTLSSLVTPRNLNMEDE